MNILIFTPQYLPRVGGVVYVIQNLAEHFMHLGHNVYLLTPMRNDSPSADEIIAGIRVFRIEMENPHTNGLRDHLIFLLRLPQSIFCIWRLLKKYHIDVINVHFLNHYIHYLLVLKRWLQIPVIASLHGSDIHSPNVFIHSKHVYRVIRYIDVFTAVSGWLLTEAAKTFPEITARAQVIYNGVDLKRFDTSIASANIDAPYMIAVGRLWPVKGTDILLQAFKKLTQYNSLYRLVILGDGPERGRLEKMSQDLGIEERIKFFGSATPDQVAIMLKGADFFVMASRREGLGLAALEAMCARKAIIATSVGGVPEIVRHGENGLLVTPGDVNSFCSAMLKLILDPGLNQRLGMNGYHFVQRFSWRQIAQQYLELYQHAICRARSGNSEQ